jgi:hypothetical protein
LGHRDWGADPRKSAGNGKLVYAMQARGDNQDPRKDGKNAFWCESPLLSDRKHKQFVLVSRHFYYFGAKAVPIPEKFKRGKPEGFKLEKKGRGFRSRFDPEDIRRFLEWLEKEPHDGFLGPGRHGDPWYQVPPKGSRKCK